MPARGELLGAECCGLGTLRLCGFGKDKVWGHFSTGRATTPLSTCALGRAAFVLESYQQY